MLIAGWLLGCSGSGGPVTPSQPGQCLAQTQIPFSGQSPGHFLWALYLVRIDGEHKLAEAIPVRQADTHWNVLKWLEQAPCTDCLEVGNIHPSGSGTVLCDVEIKHPFDKPELTGFDVRGIALFSGSRLFPVSGLNIPDRTLGDGELVNSDGYTTLYNLTTIGGGPGGLQGYFKGKLASMIPPNALLNGFGRFRSDDPANTRNAFYAGDAATVTYEIDMPDGPFVFGYAVDASWAPPISKPVDDPMTDFGPEANCEEAWKIEVQDMGPGLNPAGGSTELQIDVYDWQGKDEVHPILVECPELFDGEAEATWASDEVGFTRYKAAVANSKLAGTGTYLCLVRKEAQENDPTGKPWLDLTAYQTLAIEVAEPPLNPTDVTPAWLNFGPLDICVDGNYAYTIGENQGVHVFDLSAPQSPVWINKVGLPKYCEGLEISNDYAYVAGWANGLHIVDIAPPGSAHLVNTIDTPGYAFGAAVAGGYAFVADCESGLQVIDIDPPETASIVGSLGMPEKSYAIDVEVSGNYAYVILRNEYGGSQQFYIVDISVPELPVKVGSIDLPSVGYHAAISGGYAYVTTGNSELQIIDIEPPESAYIVNSVTTSSAPDGLVVSDGCAYVAVQPGDLQIFDIDPPESAFLVRTVAAPGQAGNEDAVALFGDYAYLADESVGIKVINIKPPESAFLADTVITCSWESSVLEENGYAYVGGYTGILIFDVDPEESAHLVKAVDLWNFEISFDISGDYGYTTADHGLDIIDISPPESAYIVSATSWTKTFCATAISGHYLYGIIQWFDEVDDGLYVVDISDPQNCDVVGSVLGGVCWDVAVSGDYAYLCKGTVLSIVSVSSPQNPCIVKSVDNGQVIGFSVAVCDGYAYVGGSDGLTIFDIDPPESSAVVNFVALPDEWTHVVDVAGGYAYCAGAHLNIIDVDPVESAHVEATLDFPNDGDSAKGVDVVDNYVYVAGYPGGLMMFKLW
jgi:hypothetical protein